MSDVVETINRIEKDFKHENPPFDGVEFPEQRLLRELSTDGDKVWQLPAEDKLAAISLFATLDYNRNASQLVDKILEAAEHDAINIFNPHEVTGTQKSIEHIFEEVAFRYKNRDARSWHKNCSILLNKYNGRWHELLLDVGCDAPTLVERLEEDGFNCLRGDKIAPMYARIIDDEVCDLHNMWDLDIPLDTHIRRLSKELFADLAVANEAKFNDDDYLRSLWRHLSEMHDISRHVVDGGIWHIGNNWDKWGKDYWQKVSQ